MSEGVLFEADNPKVPTTTTTILLSIFSPLLFYFIVRFIFCPFYCLIYFLSTLGLAVVLLMALVVPQLVCQHMRARGHASALGRILPGR